LILLHQLAACLQLAIDTYFKSVEEDPVRKYFPKDEATPSYQGMRLIAIDGTDIAKDAATAF